MQPSRNQNANGTQNLNFVTKLGMSNPQQVYFPKIEKKVVKVTANNPAVQLFYWPFLEQIGHKLCRNQF